ncbi:palmitoyltransferase ZDHHC13 [Python bivittatus]|uniref:Palmitoyltransferase n=1 Tax=Python bivittatus TaxID=176946 RepID=A0A9F2QY92_PYTBI|nr:palmitoyltransferase ZDHHC13 [Python bivittatus]
MEGAGRECKGHSHGSLRHHGHPWPNLYEDKDLSKEHDMLPFVEDCSNFDIVKATQYGLLERCQELVEAGYDVRQPDKENVTLLHWAAINNRLDLVKYFISKGAVVDQLGGDLNSTPLHWAIRQGHLSMAILLLKFGADPSLIDGEGYSSLHLAVLFQHMPIIAYLVSKGQSIDTTDRNGHTPLMVSAHKVIGREPTSFLLKFNPSVNAVDHIEKNTALHWAVIAGNINAVDVLIEAGSSLDVKNVKGEKPLDLAHQTKNRTIIHILREEEKVRIRRTSRFLRILEKNEFLLLLGSSMLLIWATGYVADLNSDSWLLKGSLLFFILVTLSFFARLFIGFNKIKYFPVAFMISSIFWISWTCFIYFLPNFSDPVSQLPFFLSMVGLIYYFYKTVRTDPGFITSTEEETKKNIINLGESGSLDFRTFCTSCLVKKPLRSMHCHTCSSCVARYDQHCIWIGRCIGVGNHAYFILFLFFLTLVNIWAINGTTLYWSEHCTTTYQRDGAWMSFTQIVSCSPWVLYIFMLITFHTSWAALWLIIQIYQVAFLGLTSHERTTLWKQSKHSKHPVSLRKTPYNHGFLQNIADFFQCRCFGILKPSVIDWTKQYTLLFPLAKDRNIHPV